MRPWHLVWFIGVFCAVGVSSPAADRGREAIERGLVSMEMINTFAYDNVPDG